MSNWERRWRILMVLLREHQIKVKMLSADLEAADSTIRSDLAQLALNFPLESRRGPNGGYRLSTQPPFAKHASFLALLMANLERVGRLNQQQEQLMQEAILALISFQIDEAVQGATIPCGHHDTSTTASH